MRCSTDGGTILLLSNYCHVRCIETVPSLYSYISQCLVHVRLVPNSIVLSRTCRDACSIPFPSQCKTTMVAKRIAVCSSVPSAASSTASARSQSALNILPAVS
jgi:hypothetical protein